MKIGSPLAVVTSPGGPAGGAGADAAGAGAAPRAQGPVVDRGLFAMVHGAGLVHFIIASVDRHRREASVLASGLELLGYLCSDGAYLIRHCCTC